MSETTPASILAVFDALAADFLFPGFNNANYESFDARMHLFRGGRGWALLVEEAVDWPGAGGPMTILFAAGPLVTQGSGLVTPFDSALATAGDDDEPLKAASLRGESIALTPVRALAEELDLEPTGALLVHLSQTQRTKLFRSAEELAEHLRSDAEHLLTIEAWCHPDVYGGPKPSESEAFVQVARVLASGDTGQWSPTEAPNNADWRFWLESH